MQSKHFKVVRALVIIAVVIGMALSFTTGVEATRRRRKVLVQPPPGPVAPFITLDDNPEVVQPTVTLTTGYFTAIRLPSPPKQLVSRLLDTGAISEQKGKVDAGNTIYLTAEKTGKRSNVVIETGYGVVNFNVVTVSGETFTRMVHVRQQKYESEVAQLQRQLASADARVATLAGQLETAQSDLAQARVAAAAAYREGRAGGLDDGRRTSAQELVAASTAWKLKKKKQALLNAWAANQVSNKSAEGGPNNATTARNANRNGN